MKTTPKKADAKHEPIALFLVTPDPYEPRRQTVTHVDPDEGIDYDRRTPGSGFAEPIGEFYSTEFAVETGETKYDEPGLFVGGTLFRAIVIERHPSKRQIMLKCYLDDHGPEIILARVGEPTF
jgi:hypothetical protein